MNHTFHEILKIFILKNLSELIVLKIFIKNKKTISFEKTFKCN